MNCGDRVGMRQQSIIEQIRVGAHLKYHCILGREHPANPIFQLIVGDPLGAKDNLQILVDRYRNKVFLVDIQSKKPCWAISHDHTSVQNKKGPGTLIYGHGLHTRTRAYSMSFPG